MMLKRLYLYSYIYYALLCYKTTAVWSNLNISIGNVKYLLATAGYNLVLYIVNVEALVYM